LGSRAAEDLRKAGLDVREFYGHRARAENLFTEMCEIQRSTELLVGFFSGSFGADGMKDAKGTLLLDKNTCRRMTKAIVFLYSITRIGEFPKTITTNREPVRSVLAYIPYFALPPKSTLERWTNRYSKSVIQDLQAALLRPLLQILAGYSVEDARRGAIDCWNALGQHSDTEARVKLCCQLNRRYVQICGKANVRLPGSVRRRL
jgi:hypothetical protein